MAMSGVTLWKLTMRRICKRGELAFILYKIISLCPQRGGTARPAFSEVVSTV